MQSNKAAIAHLAHICAEKGIQHAVISPGSRNAPLTISFDEHAAIQCASIVDERCAAFVALGMAQQSKAGVALVCTSGTAALNYAPALAEAYYQRIPLLVLTADRPVEWVDQGEGQTIRQKGIFDAYVNKSFELPQEPIHPDEQWHAVRVVSEAIDAMHYPVPGPVHINIPLREPLYGVQNDTDTTTKVVQTMCTKVALDEQQWPAWQQEWISAKQKMVIVGQMPAHAAIDDLLSAIAKDESAVVLTEHTANRTGDFIQQIDRVLATIEEREAQQFAPDLLLTFGGAVVSKRIKAFLRKNKPKAHWHVDPSGHHLDTYQSLTRVIPSEPVVLLERLVETPAEKSSFGVAWKEKAQEAAQRHDTFLAKTPYSDLGVFGALWKHLPHWKTIHLANSTPVRYAQLFDAPKGVQWLSNRGTGGIDGCTSTAVGHAMLSQQEELLITGDVGFFYDSNALWNERLANNMKILLINNGGGGIFNYIPGPSDTPQLDTFFVTKHGLKAEHLAKMYGIPYCLSQEQTQLEEGITWLASQQECALLEVDTRQIDNAQILKEYFEYLHPQRSS